MKFRRKKINEAARTVSIDLISLIIPLRSSVHSLAILTENVTIYYLIGLD